MEVNYLGHSCFSIHIGGKTLLFDPFITPNPLAKAIDIKSLKADFILISHAHFDHIADALELAQTTQAKIIAIWEICDWLQKQGYSNTHAMNIGGSFSFDFGKVQMVKAEHSSAS
jgi:L-ascorbate metabolism protein UlaG (beta-lactamase superfamily)